MSGVGAGVGVDVDVAGIDRLAGARGIGTLPVSLSHDRGTAVAVVIGEDDVCGYQSDPSED